MELKKEQLEKWDNPEKLKEIKKYFLNSEGNYIDNFSIKEGLIPISYLAKNIDKFYNDEVKATKTPLGIAVELSGDIENLEPYHIPIHNALCTLWANGKYFFDEKAVFRTMNGLTNSEKVKDVTIEEIRKYLKDFDTIRIKIDDSEQLKAYKKEFQMFSKPRLVDLMPVEFIYRPTGKIVKGYKFASMPEVLKYSDRYNQVRRIPIEFYNIKKLRATKNTITIKTYLMTQIESMKRQKGKKNKVRSNVIVYQNNTS